MGAKAWFIAYFDEDPKELLKGEPALNRVSSRALAQQLLPETTLLDGEDGTIDFLNPDRGEVLAGDFGGLRIIAHEELGGDYPSKADPRWLDPKLGSTVYLHAMHSVVDWFAFGLWRDGRLVRSLSLSPDDGIIEDIGQKLPFEQPYWDGRFPATDEDEEGEEDPYPFAFHPLELAEISLLHHLGYQFEGRPSDWVCDPAEIPIATFQIKAQRPFWKFW